MGLFDRFISKVLPLVPRPLVRQFAKPYIAGESLDDGVETIRALNADGKLATIDLLGESATELEAVARACDFYLEILERIKTEELDCNISLKPTQVGLKLDPARCLESVGKLAKKAGELRNFVRIDMEDATCTDPTLELYERLRETHDNVGVVLQSCLKRTLADARELGRKKANVRVCKGIYIESAAIAYKDAEKIRDSFVDTVRELLTAGSYVGIATHDELLIERCWALIRRLELPSQAYEFQMLYGVRPRLGDSLVKRGARLRIYVPFGREWYSYSLRRLRENPTIAGYVLKNIFSN